MRRTCVLLAVIVLAGVSHAQKPNASKDARRALMDLENRWVGALALGDVKTLNTILSDAFIDTDEDGNQTDRHGVLAALRSGEMRMSAVKLSQVHVRVYGDSAVVTGFASQKGDYRGQEIVPRIAFTDIFVLNGGEWRAVASHRSALRER